MNVLITGATGFVGQHVLRCAREAGYSIRILVRARPGRPPRLLQESPGAEVRTGDLLDPESLKGVLDGIDAVIHLVGIISEVGNSTFENIHTRATQNLVTAAQRAGTKRIVHMSALGTRPGAASRYHQTKWQAEEIVRHSGLAFTIFRPSLIYGPQDQFVNLFERMSRWSPVLPILGSGRARFQPVAVEVVAQGFVRALAEPKALGQTFDLCGPDALTMRQILDEMLSVTGRRRLKLRIPLPVARVQAALIESIFRRLLRRPPPLNRDQLIMLEEDTLGQGATAEELLGLRQVGFREGIGRYLGRDAGCVMRDA